MVRDPFTQTRPLIAASILSANFARLKSEMDDALGNGADFVHLDIMDGHFVPNISFGPAVIQSIRPECSAFFDAHLMLSEPLRYVEALSKAGAQLLTIHVETVNDVAAAAAQIRALGVRVGITLNPDTPVERLWPALDHVDVVLMMSVFPGFSGQKFIAQSLERCGRVKRRLRADQRLEIDGGIHSGNIASAVSAGCDWLVAGSAIFSGPDRAASIAALRNPMNSAPRPSVWPCTVDND